MRHTGTMIATFALLAAAHPISAQATLSGSMAKLDRNKDGKVSPTEFSEERIALFRKGLCQTKCTSR